MTGLELSRLLMFSSLQSHPSIHPFIVNNNKGYHKQTSFMQDTVKPKPKPKLKPVGYPHPSIHTPTLNITARHHPPTSIPTNPLMPLPITPLAPRRAIRAALTPRTLQIRPQPPTNITPHQLAQGLPPQIQPADLGLGGTRLRHGHEEAGLEPRGGGADLRRVEGAEGGGQRRVGG